MIHWPRHAGPDGFLERHWQKSPLLIRGGLTDIGFLPSPEELAGLACEGDIESRLISGNSDSGWQVRHGPFEDDDFLGLPETGWTLLVQDVDKHLPEVMRLLDAFDFLPRWRLDDVMISYAAPAGSVGPHIDAYDVFLLQGRGPRTWELEYEPVVTNDRHDSDVSVLARFEADERWHVEPGDIVYLPPGVAHFGYSDRPSMTCSIGFRAPAVSEMFAAAARRLESAAEARYTDSDLISDEIDGSRISSAAIDRARRLLANAVADAESGMAELLGRLVTDVKPWLLPDPPENPQDAASVIARLTAGGRLERHPGSRFAWSDEACMCWLFANGKSWNIPSGAADFCRQVADGPALGREHVDTNDAGIVRALTELIADGCLAWVEDESAGVP